MRPGRKLVGCKWVYKIKRNGTYRSRLVALGYTQVPGVDYTDIFAGVVNDITLRIVLTLWLIHDWDEDQLDVEVAFLQGILEEDETIYMKCPPGMNL